MFKGDDTVFHDNTRCALSRTIRLRRRIVLYVIFPLQRLQDRVCVEPSDSKCKTPPCRAGLQIHWSGKRWYLMTLLVLFLFLIYRTRRIKLKIDIDL